MTFGKKSYSPGLFLLAITLTLIATGPSWAKKLSDYTPYSYEVLFTNPVCKTYFYEQEVFAKNGELLTHKPKDVYCKDSDFSVAASRASSPHYRLLEWIENEKTEEIFMAFFSFSNKEIQKALCEAVERRNVKLTVVIHKSSERKLVQELEKCRPDQDLYPESQNLPEVFYKGDSGRPGRGTIGFAHNKLMIFNPQSTKEVRLVFGSANMSSGTVLHHENWNFVKTSPQSYFAQAHFCLQEAVLLHDQDKTTFREFLDQCRSEITAPVEQDIQVFFIPGDKREVVKAIKEVAQDTDRFHVAAHRFSNKTLIALLGEKLQSGAQVDLVVDDDLYWSGVKRRGVGSNSVLEFGHVMTLVKQGAQVRYMETNHNARLLHHNKFIIFQGNEQGAVFTGAGNLTESGFDDNMENFYMVTIPQVVEAYESQYQHMWRNLATPTSLMPTEMIMP